MKTKKKKAAAGNDLPLQCYFHITIGNDTEGRFMSCSGLSYELSMETYQEGGLNVPHFFPAAQVQQTLVLERGVMKKDKLVDWMRAAQEGKFQKLSGQIELCDPKGKPLFTWSIQDAFPMKYEGPSLDAMGDKVAVTRVEIMHKGILPVSGK